MSRANIFSRIPIFSVSSNYPVPMAITSVRSGRSRREFPLVKQFPQSTAQQLFTIAQNSIGSCHPKWCVPSHNNVICINSITLCLQGSELSNSMYICTARLLMKNTHVPGNLIKILRALTHTHMVRKLLENTTIKTILFTN